MKHFTMLAASGQLGSGFRESSVERAVALGAEAIGCDSGTTDFGPDSLANGHSHFSSSAVRRDLSVMLRHANAAGIPVLVGSAGVAGADANVATVVDIAREIAKESDLHFRLATIHAELTKEQVLGLLRSGKTRPLAPNGPLTESEVDESLHTVAMMGVEPYQEALDGGADVVIAGRSSDAAIYAAIPLMKGLPAAASWHSGKILECGAAAVTVRVAPDSMLGVVNEDGSFDIRPLREDYRCTPQSIASHTLYENSDPFRLVEPSGVLDTTDSIYEAIDESGVRVRDSRFELADQLTVKLEGVRLAGLSTMVFGSVRDSLILGQLDSWLEQLDKALAERLRETIGEQAEFDIVCRVYGKNGTMGSLEADAYVEGHEVAILWDVLTSSQELSHSIASSLSHMAVHNPIPEWHGLISGLAFPFAPMEVDRGPVYEYHLNHVAVPDTPTSLFPIEYEDL